MFGVRGLNVALYLDSALTQEVKGGDSVTALAGKTIYIVCQTGKSDVSASNNLTSSVGWPVCHYVNIEGKSQKGTLLLENPRGDALSLEEIKAQVNGESQLKFQTKLKNKLENLNKKDYVLTKMNNVLS